jgi:hypothetical protein
MAAREESSARDFQSSAAREGLKIVLFRSKKSGEEFIANDSEHIAVLFRSITSGDESRKSSRRSRQSGQDFPKSLSGFRFVRHESSASG